MSADNQQNTARGAALVTEAFRLADEVLFPAAGEVDRTSTIPDSHWKTLADAGFYGIALPAELGGPGLEFPQLIDILEAMMSGCLTTAFTWLQHHGVVIALAVSTNAELRERFLSGAASGELRAGVAYAGAVPTPPRMRVTRVDGGWRLDGHAPFVSGWGITELLQISARDIETDDVIAAIVETDTLPDSAVRVEPVDLSAGNGSRTVALEVEALVVPDAAVVSRTPLDVFFATQNVGTRINGTQPFGVVRRVIRLLGDAGRPEPAQALRDRAAEIRTRLDQGLGDEDALMQARADGARLAVEAASTLVVATGGPALVRGNPAERLVREAAFTLVAASRPPLKERLVGSFSGVDGIS
ncbi:acyl-CoA dehydrogenase [Gordonia amarae]|uniref:Acyl-CoA dehydrogenase/oxidase N-terminal domain-containing protein n=2 Tax=Gordonia amarae TaxID=36821 RepID=G7GLJ1_9ACTN|nr:acyl-CoA dehydrogenase family protein [Gordonia amarae]MCS3876603.1 alkylation response protein AidB-like acyl-CoA dehydrogenase [Gordonia amarae]QHN19493.1 acyl-CoA dehydrogenase [Gordonia amarae]QHN23969.1 acyl-CoA dehydrogenase [Gordonia amarae]QHN32878.1 acyl-CoA dehydrogenase [Gordonia amarae]QHN41597.1 acyl-CoA dehydrogenase [Gordonia amarae]